MAFSPSPRRLITLVLVLAATTTLWRATADEQPGKSPPGAGEEDGQRSGFADPQTLGGADRYLTHVSTDKPVYRTGETLYVRGIILHHATHKPLDGNAQMPAVIEISGPKGDVVASGQINSEDSVLGFSWPIPEGQAGGEYTVRVRHPWTGHPPAERKFDIRAYRAPRLKTQVKFLRDGYGPGDDVTATLTASRAEGGVPAGAPVTIIARIDGIEAYRGNAQVDAQGQCVARFQLPPQIARGEGTLAMVIEDGGVVETASKTIPILLQTVDLTIYPEGGDLVAGLSNRVYFEAFTPARKPADLAGVVRDDEGQKVAEFRSEHEGRGRFAFTPDAGRRYELEITEPAGIGTRYPLPEVKATGVVLSAAEDVTTAGGKMAVQIGSTAPGKFTVTLAKREQTLHKAPLELAAGGTETVTLEPGDADGVLVVTVWDTDGTPRAERLVFRQPSRSVQVAIKADASQYVPGGKARLEIETTDEHGQPLSAVVGITVTDDSVLEMIEKREQAPRLPVMVLLEDDVRELADAHVYLDAANDQAPRAVDLLLGTQGWRRFALVDPQALVAAHGDLAMRALALRIVTEREKRAAEGPEGRVLNRVDAFFAFPGAAVTQAAAQEAAAAPVAEPVLVGPEAPIDALREAPLDPEQAAAVDADLAAGKPADDRALPQGPQAEKQLEQGQRRELADALEMARDIKAKRQAILGFADEVVAIGNDMVPVRVYAHQVRPERTPGQRADFTETLCWHAGLRTDAAGKATVEFGLNDAVTSFRVFGEAFAGNGALGVGSIQIESVEPFYLEPKLPLEVTSGDRMQVPIAVVNATDTAASDARIEVRSHSSQSTDEDIFQFALPADSRVRKLLTVRVGKFSGQAELTLRGSAGPYADQVTRKLSVRPKGFPIEVGRGGMLAPGGVATHEISVPDTLVPGSLQARVVVYPTPLASMTEALERLIQEPCGCFEQTSSTTYPLVMAQQYFMSHQGVDPSLVERSADILEKGYQRLTGFESPSGGYEWFGSDPGHDALTAYGLLQFTDMVEVRHVDTGMLERTKKWLLGQRDGKGGFARKTHTLHTWLADPECANTYNTWALLEAGIQADLSREVGWVRDAVPAMQNTYALALAANVLALGGEADAANQVLDKLAGLQADDGSLSGATTSVIGSGGEALAVETTALAALAWLRNPSYTENVEKSIRYLAETCKAGRFGSTQSTILALRAIVTYDQSRARPKAPGALQLVVDGQKVGAPVAFTTETQGAIELPEIAAQLTPGKHQVQLAMEGGSDMPFSLAVKFHSLKPDSSEECKLYLEAALNDVELEEGAVTEAQVSVTNRSGEVVPTPVAIIGLPGGLEPRHDQLKELVKAGKIAAYEVLGREVVLYWRSLEAEQRVDLPLSLVAAVPGSYTGPASRAYLYYTDEHKHWVDGLEVTITAKGEL